MKYLIILLSLFAASVHASGYPYSSGSFPYGATPEHKAKMQYYHQQYSKPRVTHSVPNIFGGEDFYGNKGYMGRTMPNVHGGRDFYRNY